MKREKTINFLAVTLFFGILLSFLLYIGLGTMLDFDTADDESKGFNEVFFSDGAIRDFGTFCNYRLFGHIDDSGIIVGDDGWLFEATDSVTGYERLLDYIGGSPYTEEQLARIADNIRERKEFYNAAGAEYVLVVIPDSMTVCNDKLPSYLGSRSENARLALLSAYLAGEHSALLNPTATMIEESAELPMYNNTENSINTYGAYCIYNSVISRYLSDTGREVDRLRREDVDFYVHTTDGRAVATKAGIERTVRNRTVSLSDDMPENYVTVSSGRGYAVTERTDAPNTLDKVIVECSNEWDRIQLTPYFSNTFGRVIYRNYTSAASYQNGVGLVIQIIHEGELDILLENN